MAKVNIVKGNPCPLSITLRRQSVEVTSEGAKRVVKDFFPGSGAPVKVLLQCGAYRQQQIAAMSGNIAVVHFDETLDTGLYGIEVLCQDSDGQPCRWKRAEAVEVHDESIGAGLEEDVEFDDTPYHLGTAIFPGVVIADMGGGGGYVKPDSGIPKEDLSEEVQESLDKADKAGTVQSVSVNGGTPVQPVDGNVNLLNIPTKEYVDGKLTEVVINEISGAADIVTINDADLAFVDSAGNIAMQVSEGHVKAKNFDSRQVGTNTTAIQQLRQQISQQSNVQADVVVKEDDDAALDFADTAGNVVLRIAKDGQIKTKAFDSSAMNVFKQLKLDKPQCVCHGYGASEGQANSITYFRNAVAKGYEAFEVDAVNCSDGIPVCTHHYNSYTVKRKSDDETVELQFSEISSTDLVNDYTWPNGEPIALLTDVIWYICYLKRYTLFVDGQRMNSESRKYASDYAEELGVGEYVFHFCDGVTVPYPTGIKRLNMVLYPRSASDVQRLYLAHKTADNNLMFSVNGSSDEEITAIAEEAHTLGCMTYTWTYSNIDAIRQQMKLGADYIITTGIVNNQI